jgi:hypothetical protein
MEGAAAGTVEQARGITAIYRSDRIIDRAIGLAFEDGKAASISMSLKPIVSAIGAWAPVASSALSWPGPFSPLALSLMTSNVPLPHRSVRI